MDHRDPSINVQLPIELLNRLNKVCKENLIGRGLVIRTAIERTVAELEKRPLLKDHLPDESS